MNEVINIITTVMRASSHRFVGRLGRDPEVRFLDSGKAVANGRIAINVPGSKQGDGKEPDWFKVEVWGEEAQAFADQCRKGDLVEVVGRVKSSRWQTQTGENKLELVVTADAWSLVRSAGQVQPAAAAPAPAAPALAPIESDDIPF